MKKLGLTILKALLFMVDGHCLSAFSQHQRMKILLSGDFGQSCFPFCVRQQQSVIAFGLQKKEKSAFFLVPI